MNGQKPRIDQADERYFINSRGKKILSRSWLPDSTPEAYLLFLHGYSEHSGRYTDVARYFVKEGFAVYALDYEGHGKSSGLRCDVREFSYYVDDAQQLYQAVRDAHDDQPLYIFGQCIGALVGIQLARRIQEDVSGLILSAPMFKFAPEVPKIVQDTAGYISAMAATFPILSLDYSTFSREETVVQAFLEDELNCKGKLRARMVSHIIEQGRKSWKVLQELDLPVWIGHGSDDEFADPASTEALLDSEKENLKVNLFDGHKHFLLHEQGSDRILGSVCEWIGETDSGDSDSLEVMEAE